MRMGADVDVRKMGTSEDDFRAVFDMLMALYAEGGYAPLDAQRAAENCFRVIEEGMCFAAFLGNVAVGTLALTELPFWYSAETFLQDAWLFVRPEYRANGVGVSLMRAARAEGDARNKIVFVTINNPDRRPRRSTASLESHVAGYVPVGFTMKVG